MSTKTLSRVWHPWWAWECYRAGFFNNAPPTGMTRDEARLAYRDFLADLSRFERGIIRVFFEWPRSTEHWLTNESMNRVAWIGQSAMCITTGVSSAFRSGFCLLSDAQQVAANAMAQRHLDRWVDEWKRHQQVSV